MAIELQENDKKLLEILRWSRISWDAPLELQIFGERSDAAKTAVRALVKRRKDYVQSVPLFGTESYYQLNPVGARLLGSPEECGGPLGAQALVTHFGMAHYTSLRVPPWPRLTRTDLQNMFPEHWKDLLPNEKAFLSYHCIGLEPQPSLIRMYVDHGGDAGRLLLSCRDDIRDAALLPGLGEAIKEGVYRLTIITADALKKESLDSSLKANPLPVPVFVYLAPEMLNLMGRSATKKKRLLSPHVVSPLEVPSGD